MKDSGIEWIGEIPKGWKIKKLKNIIATSLLYGANESGIPYEENLPRYIRITDIADNNLRNDIPQLSLTEIQASGFLLEDKDILFARSGATVGKSFIFRQKYGRCAFAGYLIKASINKENSADFVYYYTLSTAYDEWKSKVFIQSTIQNIGANKYALLDISIPPLSEQQSIVNHLDWKCAEIDNLISLQEEMIAELKAYKQSVITEAVCKGLDKNVPMKDSGVEWIGEIPEHWEIRKVTHIYENIGSGTTPKSSNESYYVDEGYSFLQTGDLNDGIIERTSKYLSEKALEECSLKTYLKGGLVIAMYGATIGKLGILNIDTVTNQACCVLSGNSVYDKMFSFYVFFADRPNLIMQANGGGQPNISQDIIKRDKLPVPPLSEQQTIANYLDKKCANIDQLISIKQQKADELKEYKKSMIYEYVTGKKEVI